MNHDRVANYMLSGLPAWLIAEALWVGDVFTHSMHSLTGLERYVSWNDIAQQRARAAGQVMSEVGSEAEYAVAARGGGADGAPEVAEGVHVS